MNAPRFARVAWRFLSSISTEPMLSLNKLNTLPWMLRGARLARRWRDSPSVDAHRNGRVANLLQQYAEAHTIGPGIWKWDHYFDIYQRHFARFVGTDVHVVEVGIFSGGSLGMWRDYFGSNAHIFGIDIDARCSVYEGERTRIFIGDQSDRTFWADFRRRVPRVDILIDDGGHQPEQQIVTLEEMLPHLSRSGIYLCEDMHHVDHKFAAYVFGLTSALNAYMRVPGADPVVTATPLQQSIHSVHLYPFVTVLEKTADPVSQLVSHRYGTEWQPFLV